MPPGRDRPRRPAHFGLDAMEAHGGTLPGPGEMTKWPRKRRRRRGVGRAARDPEVTARPWPSSMTSARHHRRPLGRAPARSLPGALWRLYALREWVRRSPERQVEYAAGCALPPSSTSSPGPRATRPGRATALADAILGGVYEGDLAVALYRAAAFCRVISAGRASSPPISPSTTPPRAWTPPPPRPCSQQRRIGRRRARLARWHPRVRDDRAARGLGAKGCPPLGFPCVGSRQPGSN